jgi:outer membrane autotransporter protein
LLPPGAKGPERNNDLRGWAKYYGQFYNHDAQDLNPEYETTLHGGVIGVDKSFGNLLIGVGGGAGNYATTTGTDSEETIKAYQGSLYGTFGTERAYFDAGIAYGFNEVETETGGPFVLNGEFDAQIISGYLGGGYDLVDTKGGTVFTPEASIQYSMYEQDAYSETGTTAVPRNIDAFDADSLRSSLGLNVSMLNTTALKTFGFKLDGRFHWLHEFNPEPGSMTFSLEGGNNHYQLAHPLLDEELFRAGFGFSFFNTMRNKPKNVLFRLDFDELFGDGFNSHNLSAKVIYAF